MSVRPVPDGGAAAEAGRRFVIERPPVVVEGVADYSVDEEGTYYLFGPGGKPAGDFRRGTVQAAYFADAAAAVQAQAG